MLHPGPQRKRCQATTTATQYGPQKFLRFCTRPATTTKVSDIKRRSSAASTWSRRESSDKQLTYIVAQPRGHCMRIVPKSGASKPLLWNAVTQESRGLANNNATHNSGYWQRFETVLQACSDKNPVQ